MLIMKYIGLKTEYNVEFSNLTKNLVQVKGDIPAKTHGFTLSRPEKNDGWDYSEFTTIYREMDGIIQFSNDGSVYVPPEPKPEPEPYVPTLEELKMRKISDAYVGKQSIWAQGYKVITANGLESFSLTGTEIDYIPNLQAQYNSFADKIAFYSNDSNGWIFYTREDIGNILEVMENLVLRENSYCEDFIKWINSLETVEDVEARYYGEELPDEYKSEVTLSFETN